MIRLYSSSVSITLCSVFPPPVSQCPHGQGPGQAEGGSHQLRDGGEQGGLAVQVYGGDTEGEYFRVQG